MADKGKGRGKIFPILIGVVLVAAIAVGVLWFLSRGEGEKTGLAGFAQNLFGGGGSRQSALGVEGTYLPGEPFIVYAGETPQFEVTFHGAYELNQADKEHFSVTREPGRLVAIELDVRLLDLNLSWRLYNRRIRSADGLWLDEVASVSDPILLAGGNTDAETIIVSIPPPETVTTAEAADSEAAGDGAAEAESAAPDSGGEAATAGGEAAEAVEAAPETLAFYIYSASWNREETAAGKYILPIKQAVAPSASVPSRAKQSEFGQWLDGVYTSAALDLTFALPEGWQLQTSSISGSTSSKSMEGTVHSGDGGIMLQIAVDKNVADATAQSSVDYFRGLLNKTSASFTVEEPFQRLIAGKNYLGLAYSHADATRGQQIYFYKVNDNIINITLQYIISERLAAEAVLDALLPLR
ncbi:MAG: hypothetical protein LBK98_03765 [Peptococcaceae bacterium]|jgi:hypothetical protein|nr:hypothetical protein [Peptococcaceae bacterium]